MINTLRAAVTSAGVVAMSILAGIIAEFGSFQLLHALNIVGMPGGLVLAVVAIGGTLGAVFYAAANS